MPRLPLLRMAGLIAGLSLGVGSPAEALSLASGLEGYWQFEGDGSDSSTQGRDLTVPGGASYATGLFGQAVNVGGLESNAPFRSGSADDAALDFGSGEFTVQVWVNFTATSSEQILIEKFTGPSGPGWTLYKSSDGKFALFAAGAAAPASGSQSLAPLVFYHVVARRSGDDFELFLNNNSIQTQSSTSGAAITDTDKPLLIGAREGGSQDFPLKGKIDEVAIWSRALSDAEISTLYNEGNGMLIPEPTTSLLLATGLAGLAAAGRRRPS